MKTVEPRQVFWNYDYTGRERPEYRFCPMCAQKLVPRVKDQTPVCPSCGFVDYKNPSPGAVVLIVDGGKLLLGRRGDGSFRKGKWCFPGGFVEYNEDFLSAAIREVKEETNLDVEILSILSVISNFFEPNLHTLVINLIGRVTGGTARAGDDIEELAWFPLSEPLPELAFEAEAHIIDRYRASPFAGASVDPRFTVSR